MRKLYYLGANCNGGSTYTTLNFTSFHSAEHYLKSWLRGNTFSHNSGCGEIGEITDGNYRLIKAYTYEKRNSIGHWYVADAC